MVHEFTDTVRQGFLLLLLLIRNLIDLSAVAIQPRIINKHTFMHRLIFCYPRETVDGVPFLFMPKSSAQFDHSNLVLSPNAFLFSFICCCNLFMTRTLMIERGRFILHSGEEECVRDSSSSSLRNASNRQHVRMCLLVDLIRMSLPSGVDVIMRRTQVFSVRRTQMPDTMITNTILVMCYKKNSLFNHEKHCIRIFWAITLRK